MAGDRENRFEGSPTRREGRDGGNMDELERRSTVKQMKCPECGGMLAYEPGSTHMKCPYCAAEFPIEQRLTEIRELDYYATVSRLEEESATEEAYLMKCTGCGAEIKLGSNVTSGSCPYCATPFVVDQAVSKKALKPRYILPFHVGAKRTTELFRNWLNSLWFAPGSLKKLAREDSGLSGIYVPYRTFDAATSTTYSGERGDYYYEEETVEVERGGEMVSETRRVRKIDWTWVWGEVYVNFDDMLILATQSLRRDYARALEPWDLNNLVEYDERYLSGFLSESYQIGPTEGFDRARELMADHITSAIEADIGGDRQRIYSAETAYHDVTFKHILLPVWINSYRYAKKVYTFLVNARTGEVQGERPWSWIKIALLVLGLLAAAYGIVMVPDWFQ